VETIVLPNLTLDDLNREARDFATRESLHHEPLLFGVTDGKAIGTYFEHKFRRLLQTKFTFDLGSSAKGIDFPELGVDMKVTSLRQPQSSCPFRSARQKIYGLGYSLLVFVYDKTDDDNTRTGSLRITHTIFVDQTRTADFQTTTGLRRIVANDGNLDDIIAYFQDRFLPVDEVTAQELAEEILATPPQIGYLTISNALQWRLQYRRVIEQAGQVEGVHRLL
jgi:hypothetical protein